MTSATLRELIETHDELRRLLALGQPPAVAVLLCARFLEATEDAAKGWWAGFGFHVSLEMARRIPSLSLEGIDPAEITRFERILAIARDRPVPPLPGETEWSQQCDRAITFLRKASGASPGAYAARPDAAEGTVEIRVPVISTLAGDGRATHPLFADASVASILRLSVDADLVEREGGIVIDGPISPESRAGFETAVETLGRLPGSGPRNALIRVRWTPEGRLIGRSASFPFFLAAAAARSRFSPGLESVSLEGHFTATGDLDRARVVTVEPSTLPGKVRASFHAGARALLVPQEQEAEARREAARLADEGPGGFLDIIGVRDARDAWRDRRILRRHVRSPRRLVGGWLHWLTRSRIRLAFVGSIALFLAALSIAAAVITRDLPTEVGWKGDDLVFRNPHGWITRRIHFPYEDKEPNPGIGPSALVLSIEKRPVALVIHGSVPGRHDRLAALDRRGRPIWEVSSTDVRGIDAHDLEWRAFVPLVEMEGRPEILAVRRSTQQSLTLVDRIDARTGTLLGELRNDGHLEWLSWVDPAREGTRRPAIMGTNNRTGRGIVAILETGSMDASDRIASIGEIPSITDPRSLGRGVAAAWSFPKDRFTRQLRISCSQVEEEEGDLTMVAASDGGRTGGVIYYLEVEDLGHPVVARAQITDGYRAHIAGTQLDVTPGDLADEENRLSREVQNLTPAGWKNADFLQASAGTSLGR